MLLMKTILSPILSTKTNKYDYLWKQSETGSN
jgi:hypothetical protein